jgi:HPP family
MTTVPSSESRTTSGGDDNNDNNRGPIILNLDPIDDDDDDINLTHTAAISDFDTRFFHQVVQDAGRWAFGVVMVEVWVMNENRTHLFRPVGGLWVDPLAHDYGSNDKFARILDPQREDFFKALPFAPGVGLPGILWAEGREGNAAIDQAHHHSPFPNALSARNLPTLNRNRSNNSRSRSNKNNNVGNGSRRRGRRHRRGNALHFENFSGVYDEGSEDKKDGAGGVKAPARGPADTLGMHEKDNRPTVGHRHRKTASDVETGEWAAMTSSGRILPGAGDRVKKAISKNLPFSTSQVSWRDVAAIADDPDQPFNPRIKYLQEECGLGWAAGVPFHIGTTDGVVMYMARETVDVEKLLDKTNDEYIAHSSLVIGSAYALRMPRLAAEKERRSEGKETIRRVRNKLHTIRALNRNVETFIEDEAAKDTDEKARHEFNEVPHGWALGENAVCYLLDAGLLFFITKVTSTYKKSMGVQVQPPPATTWEQSCVTFVASFLTILVLTSINHSLVQEYGPGFELVLGPFGAMSTLLYSLTSAPASQPRNAILGQATSLFIAYGFGRTNIDKRWKHSLATATAVAFMAKTGLSHPPGMYSFVKSMNVY